MIVWSTLRGWSKDEQSAVIQPVVVAVFAMTLALFGASCMFSGDTIRLLVMGLPAAALGTWLGTRLYCSLDEAHFRSIVLLLLLISGLSLLPSVFVATGK